MMTPKRRLVLGARAAAGAVFLVVALTACSNTPSTVQQNNAASNTANATLLASAIQQTGFTPLTTSEEMVNILTRLQRQNDPNHISYLYLFLPGVPYPVKHFVVKGKCTSTDSQAVNNTQPVGSDGNGNPTVVIDAAQLDGSFGTNEPGIFCFADDPQRSMITWSGLYFQSDAPILFPDTPLRIAVAK